jgi:hypothetical protein
MGNRFWTVVGVLLTVDRPVGGGSQQSNERQPAVSR